MSPKYGSGRKLSARKHRGKRVMFCLGRVQHADKQRQGVVTRYVVLIGGTQWQGWFEKNFARIPARAFAIAASFTCLRLRNCCLVSAIAVRSHRLREFAACFTRAGCNLHPRRI